MTLPRLTPFVLICWMAGCQTAQRVDCPLATSRPRRPEPASPEVVEPVSLPVVERVGYIQLPEVPAEPEPATPLLPMPVAEAEFTLEQLEQMALAHNPSLGEARAGVEAARGNWVQVGLPPNTSVGYLGQQLGSGGTAEQQGLFLEQKFVRGGKLRLNRAVACREIEMAEQMLAAQSQRVLTDVRLGYYEVLIAQRRSELTQQLAEIADRAVHTTEALFNAKEVSQVDVMRAKVELQSAQLLHKKALNLQTAAWTSLATVLGRPDLRPAPLQGDVESIAVTIDADTALRRLLSQSPELAAALTEVERARWALERADAEPIPNLDVQAVVQNDNSTNSGNANLQVTMPIPWLNWNQGGIRQAHAEFIAAQRAVERLQLSLQQRLAGVYEQYASARNQVEDYSKDEGILQNSKSTLDAIRDGFEAGEIGYLDLLTTQRTHSQTHLAYLEALSDLWSAIVEIDGLLLKNCLAGSPST